MASFGKKEKFTFELIRHGSRIGVFHRRAADDDFPVQLDIELAELKKYLGGYDISFDGMEIGKIQHKDASSELSKFDLESKDKDYSLWHVKHEGKVLFRARYFDEKKEYFGGAWRKIKPQSFIGYTSAFAFVGVVLGVLQHVL
eukprot:Lankesteria_metandrocarpae@DN5207_c1_g1_i1.p1